MEALLYTSSFFIILPVVAFLYASVGHGGASGYLALMAVFSLSPEVMKPTALLLNLVVSAVAFYHYYKAGYFNKKLFLSFAISSVPAAFIGGLISVDANLYKKILGVLLLFAILKMLNVFGKEQVIVRKIRIWQGLIIGAVIGLFSGMIGIGGGIILSPVILLFHWGKMKEAAAVSALFIWVNSASGLLGQLSTGVSFTSETLLMVVLAVFGGFFGSFYGSKKFKNNHLRVVLAFVLLLASVKLLII